MKAVLLKLNYPFSYGVNPFIEEINEDVLDWAKKFNLLPSEESAKQFDEGKLNWFSARLYPTADPEGLFLTCCWTTLFFLADDICDKVPTGQQKAYVEGLYKTCMDILQNEPISFEKDNVFEACFVDLWQRFKQRADSEWLTWYIQEMKDYFEAWIQEAEHLDHNEYFQLEDFLHQRPYFSGGRVCLSMVSLATKFHLPHYIYQNPVVQELMHIAASVPALANELHSLGKELKAENRISNLISLLREARQLTFSSAIDEILDIHNKALVRFQELKLQLPSVDPQTDSELLRYVQALEAMSSGNHEWAMNDTNRYYDTFSFTDMDYEQ